MPGIGISDKQVHGPCVALAGLELYSGNAITSHRDLPDSAS